jgi:hypothetical protein
MTLQQGVVMASWDADKREYLAQVGSEHIQGLGPITKRLGENGWEIISVVTVESSGASTGNASKANQKTRIATDVLAIFIKRYRAASDDGVSGGS